MIERYQSQEIARIFSDENRLKIFLRIESLLLEELAGDYPISRSDIRKLKNLEAKVSASSVRRREAVTRHEITAFLEWIWAETPGAPGVANFLHLGLTSSDLMDSALALQCKEALEVVLSELDCNIKVLEQLAKKWRQMTCIGRTHGIHAEVTSLGFKFLGFLMEGQRSRRRLSLAVEEIAVGKLSGSVGNFASSAIDPKRESKLLSKLGLGFEPAATQVVARDRHAVLLARLALLGGWIERLALEIRHLQRTEVGELAEPFKKGQHGSSSMPHKKNPVLSENLCGLARLLRAYAGAGLENMALWHERDISHSSVERVVIPDAFHAAHFMLGRLREILEGLVVRRDNVNKNVALLGDLSFSQAYLNRLLAAGLPRRRAYSLIQEAAFKASANGRSLWQELASQKGQWPKSARLTKLKPEDFLKFLPALYKRCGLA
ncbi:MAG: adenylosuccinate lyase [Elusimicrobia bacterium]|nr:adenylosuccinate lyase [Elusimicrobiota bacterium]